MIHNGIPTDFMSPGVLGRNTLVTHRSALVDDVTIALLTILHLNTVSWFQQQFLRDSKTNSAL